VLITFVAESRTALLFDRRVEDRTLTFSNVDGRLLDEQTGTQWDPVTGGALAGSLKGAQLTPEVGVVAYRRAWGSFYPESSYWRAGE
jgi:hypothetical protein